MATSLFKEVVFKFIDKLEGFMKDSPSLLRVGIGCKLLRDTRWKGGEVVDHFIKWIASDYLEAALSFYEVLIILGSPIEANESVKHLCPESEEASLTRDL